MNNNRQQLHKVEGHPHLRKDPRSGAVLNIDSLALKAARDSKSKRIFQAQLLENHSEQINHLKEEMREIKALLKQVVAKL